MKSKMYGKSFFVFVGVLLLFAVLIASLYANVQLLKPLLNESTARAIAEKACVKGGETIDRGVYDSLSKSWNFDANLNSQKIGCNAICSVNVVSQSAQLKWICSNNKTVSNSSCGIENCHGLDIKCGPKPAQICTMMYQIGDKCRQFANCGVVNGACSQINNEQFNDCKSCVEKCEKLNVDNPEAVSICENSCGQ